MVKVLSMTACLMCSSLYGGTLYWQVHEPDIYAFANKCSHEPDRIRISEPTFYHLCHGLSEHEYAILLEMICDCHEFQKWVIVDRLGNEHEIDWLGG